MNDDKTGLPTKLDQVNWLKDKAKQIKVLLYAAYFAITDAKTSKWVKGFIILSAIYLIVPIDLIPDVIPGLGLIDDIAMVFLSFGSVGSRINARHIFEARRRLKLKAPKTT